MKIKYVLLAGLMTFSSVNCNQAKALTTQEELTGIIGSLFAYQSITQFCQTYDFFTNPSLTKLVLWSVFCRSPLQSGGPSSVAAVQTTQNRLGFNQQRDFKGFSNDLKTMKPGEVSKFCKKLKESTKPEAKALITEIGC